MILPVVTMIWSKTVLTALARLPMRAFPMSSRHRADGVAAELMDDHPQTSVVPMEVVWRITMTTNVVAYRGAMYTDVDSDDDEG